MRMGVDVPTTAVAAILSFEGNRHHLQSLRSGRPLSVVLPQFLEWSVPDLLYTWISNTMEMQMDSLWLYLFKVSVAFADRLQGYDKLKELLVEVIRSLAARRNVFGNFPIEYELGFVVEEKRFVTFQSCSES